MDSIIEISKETLQRIDEAKTLPDKQKALFDEWKKAHRFEEDWRRTTVYKDKTMRNCKPEKIKMVEKHYITKCIIGDDIIFPGIEQDSFVEDGYIDEMCYLNARCKILFILKEPNILMVRKKIENADSRSSVIWFKEFIDNNINDNRPRLREKLARMAYYILEKEKDRNESKNDDIYLNPDEKSYKAALRQTAFMNLNKRGGDNKEVANKLVTYTKRYQKFIKKQIEILKPDYIVLLLSEGLTKILLEDIDIMSSTKAKIIDMWHPSKQMRDVSQDKVIASLQEYNKNIAKYMHRFVEMYNSAMNNKSQY